MLTFYTAKNAAYFDDTAVAVRKVVRFVRYYIPLCKKSENGGKKIINIYKGGVKALRTLRPYEKPNFARVSRRKVPTGPPCRLASLARCWLGGGKESFFKAPPYSGFGLWRRFLEYATR